jgi:hypothetical protein
VPLDPELALDAWTTVLTSIALVAVIVLVLIVVAPWRKVRAEPPLDPDVEARVLLHRDPDEVTGESAATRVAELDDARDDRPLDGLEDLRDPSD